MIEFFKRLVECLRLLVKERPRDLSPEEIAKRKAAIKLNGVFMPRNLRSSYVSLAKSVSAYVQVPATVDLRDYCTQTENQGSLPYCAAYTAAGFAENILWRKTDRITQIDPAAIYKRAKEIDGDPRGEGTSLTAVLAVLLEKKYFDSKICKTQIIYDDPGFENVIKYAIHKFGCCLLACNITEEWYHCNPNKTSITGSSKNTTVGGHAILCCGYNRDGVIIHNSWGESWGAYGFALVTWKALRQQFMYAAVLTNALNDMRIN